MPLLLASSYLQVWCMCYFYNRETIQLLNNSKGSKNEWPNSGGKNCTRGEEDSQPALSYCLIVSHSKLLQQKIWPDFQVCSFPHCVTRLSWVKTAWPRNVKKGGVKKFNHNSVHLSHVLSGTDQQKAKAVRRLGRSTHVSKAQPGWCSHQSGYSDKCLPQMTVFRFAHFKLVCLTQLFPYSALIF